ncbi:hypothetical protein [Polaribacter atrinae]|uniref:hypothetical protein n=1 Tax=Polaribacter atrinae TaxID=1333662 RepID=UPI0030F6F233
MKNKLLFLVLLLCSFYSYSQQEITWQDLAAVTYTDKFFKEYNETFMYPTFLPSVKALNGKQITIKGYF